MDLEKSFSYWKGHVTLADVFAEELAYSLIYDNIRADRVDVALGTVELTELPDRFFLIQVDDYMNLSGKLSITQEFFQKPRLVNLLRDLLRERGIRGFVANLVGMDKFICFLCGVEEQQLPLLAEEFKAVIRRQSPYTVSLCVSEHCSRIAQYSRMYPRMDVALSRSYFSGKEFTIFLSELSEGEEPAETEESPDRRYPELLAAIIRGSRERFEQQLEQLLRSLPGAAGQPRRARLEIIRILQRFESYCLRCGIPEGEAKGLHEETMDAVLHCNFISDVRRILLDYYEAVTALLRRYSGAGELAFRLLVEEYVAAHYQEELRPGTLSAVLGFSEGHFTRLFRRDFGCTFVQYLSDYRIRRSCRLLSETSLPVEQVAYRVGIDNYSYFCTCFKRSVGVTPGVYRKKCAAERKNSEEDRNSEILC